MSGAAPAGLFLRRRPESLQGYVAQVVLRKLSDAEMGIDLRDRGLGDSHRRPACPVVAPWARELIRPPHWWLDTFRGSCLSGRTAPQCKRRSYGQKE